MNRLLTVFFIALLFLVLGANYAQAQIPVPYCVVMDWDACAPSGSVPTTSCTASSTFGETPTTNSFSGTTYLTVTSTGQYNPWVGITPTCAGTLPTSTVGLTLTIPSGSPQNTLTQYFNSGTGPTVGSAAVPWMTDVPQNAPQVGGGQYYDTFDISTNGGFVNFQWANYYQTNALDWDFECGGCTQNPASYRLLPSNTWWIVNEYAGGATSRFIGMWNGTTGQFITNSLANGPSASAQVVEGYYVGTGVGHGLPVGDHVYLGTVMICGVTTRESECPFPLPPGLQELPPVLSLVSGSYSSPQTVTIGNLPGELMTPGASVYYTTDGSTPSCTLGANDTITATHGTKYTSPLTISVSATLQAITCMTYYQNSTVTSATYTITAGGGVLAPARSIDWTGVGSCPGVPAALPDQGCVPNAAETWTQSGTTIAAYGSSGSPASTSTIQTALNSCSGGEYVLLGSGTFYLTGTISVPANCELRGAGANSTFLLNYGSGGCMTGSAFVCIQGSNNYANGEQNHATWTAGFSKGATSITLSNSTNLAVGGNIILDQQDETADTGYIWNCLTTPCGAANSGGGARTDNTCSSSVSPNNGHCSQEQVVTVVSCSPSCNNSGSTTVTITPALRMANWRSAQSTGAWWPTTTLVEGGIRDLTLDMTNASTATSPIIFWNCYECFAYQVKTVQGARNHIGVQYSKNVTVMSSYAYLEASGYTGTSSYAIEIFDTSDTLVLNNICQRVVECTVQTGGGTGNIAAYNFPVSSDSNATGFMTQMDFDHGSGDSFLLKEGEIVSGIQHDNTHGTHHFFTDFRNVLEGWAPASSCNGTACTTNTVSDFIYGGSRYGNVVGNLVGQSGYHTVSGSLYFAPSSGTCGNSSWKIIFLVGCGESGATFCATPTNCSGGTAAYDPLAENSLMLYENYDVITGASCTGTNTPTSGCVGSTASSFGDASGSTSSYVGLASPGTLPPSLLFTSAPFFFGSLAWPSVGPDVSGGNLLLCASGSTYAGSYVTNASQCGGSAASAFAGHANANPAMNCALNVMGMNPDGSGSVSAFNPTTCYNENSSPGVPVCGWNGDQTPLLPSSWYSQGTVSGSIWTWNGKGTAPNSSMTGTVYLYPLSGNAVAYTISSANSTSITLTTSPAAGTYDATYGQNWNTFTAPSLGSFYIDPMSGCQITRVSQWGSGGAQGVVYDSEVGAFSEDDKMIWMQNPQDGEWIVSTPADSAHTPGSIVLSSSQMPSVGGSVGWVISWNYSQANQFYIAGGSSGKDILLATINGLPGCIGTPTSAGTCSVTTTVIKSFASSGGSTGNGYTAVTFTDKYDNFPGYLTFVGFNSNGTMDVDTWNLTTSTNTIWHTTTCTGTPAPQPGCVHGVLPFPDGSVLIGYGGSDGSYSGDVWFHGNPSSPTATQMQPSSNTGHNASGTDLNGVMKWVEMRQALSSGIEACPTGQWSGANSNGGLDLTVPTDPGNALGGATCAPNVNWEQQEFSWHGPGGSTQPYFLSSFWDNNRSGSSAEYMTNNADYNVTMPTCTQVSTTTSGNCWVPYQDEIVLVNSGVNMNTVCTSSAITCLGGVYRMGLARARSLEAGDYYGIPNPSISRDASYVAFNSNMAYPNGASGGCTGTDYSNGSCSEVYILSAPGGGPLFQSGSGPINTGPPAPASNLFVKAY